MIVAHSSPHDDDGAEKLNVACVNHRQSASEAQVRSSHWKRTKPHLHLMPKGLPVIHSIAIKALSVGSFTHSRSFRYQAVIFAIKEELNVVEFAVYLFDENGALLQVIPIRTMSDDRARQKAKHLAELHHAATHFLMPFDNRHTNDAPSGYVLLNTH